MYPKVSIIFVNYNGGKQPIECLKSIFRLNYPQRKIEIIVIDNGSTDGSLKKIKRFHKVKLIENKSNLGFAGSINQGVLISKGEYIFMGNDDIVFEKDSLLEMVQFAKSRPEIGVIGGKILDKVNPKRVISLGYFMNKITGNVYPNKSEDLSKSIDWLQGCALLISRKTLKKVGLFDPDFYPIFFEDYDLCLRIRKLDLGIRVLPTAVFFHGESLTSNKNLPLKYYFWYRNKIRFMLKNLPLINILSILFFQSFLVIPYRFLILRDRRSLPYLKGLWWNISNIKQTFKVRGKL